MVTGMGVSDLFGTVNGLEDDEFFSEWNTMNGTVNGLQVDEFFSELNTMNGTKLEGPQPVVHHDNSMGPNPSTGLPPNGNLPSLSSTGEADSSEDTEIFSDIVLTFINRMLMEEDVDEKLDTLQGHLALEATKKPFYDILGEKNTLSPDQPPLNEYHSSESPSSNGNSNGGSSSSAVSDKSWDYDIIDFPSPQDYHVSVGYSSQSSLSSINSNNIVLEGLEDPLLSKARAPHLFSESLPAWQFRKGVEEARKFLPNNDKLVIDLDLENNGFFLPQEQKEASELVEVKVEERENMIYGSRGRKNPHSEDLYIEEVERSNKQSALDYSEETLRSEMFDLVLLCPVEKCLQDVAALREVMQNEASKSSQNGHSKGSGGGRGRGRKQSKSEMVDLRTLLIHCAQAVATGDRRTANELLKQIRQHSSPFGDGTQRLAHCFADGLEARLAGTGSEKYRSLVAKRVTAADNLKAYQLYMHASPFKRISHFFSNQTILSVTEKATRVHIIDFGVHFGFQWPQLIQSLSSRPGGPPELRFTGIDIPEPGFRPAQRIEETGRRLAEYARDFKVPFEYHAIAAKWETIGVDDIKMDQNEVVIVNCQYRFSYVADESVSADSPRDMVLNTIRKLKPAVFIEGVGNGSYDAPFFVTRFREAMFHFSAMFDMLDVNVPRDDARRLLVERDMFGRMALNVIACEGSERVERPETYKKWQVRNHRAGFEQLPLNQDMLKKAKDKVKKCYHKDFIVDEDSPWLLQGWKGRIISALSFWRPSNIN